ncbi:MAG: fasciclin domain-containing protein [Bryobacteraceae bacterium]
MTAPVVVHFLHLGRVPCTQSGMMMGAKLFAAGATSMAMASPARAADIVDTAAAKNFTTIVAAVKAAGLVDALKGEGPFTVFAPTEEAFAKLPAGTLEELLKPENKDKLVKILTYHVVPGKVMAADVVKLSSAKTVQGGEVRIDRMNGQVLVNGATVIKADVAATNGVIHVIDTVIVPE